MSQSFIYIRYDEINVIIREQPNVVVLKSPCLEKLTTSYFSFSTNII